MSSTTTSTARPDRTPSRRELFDLYRIAIDEYRFEVRLNWERMRYYLVFNAAILGAGTALLEQAASGVERRFTAVVFVVGAFTVLVGVVAVRRGRQYYRNTIVKKTLIENALGLDVPAPGHGDRENLTLAVGTTAGMSRTEEILSDTDAWLRRGLLRPGSIAFWIATLLWMFVVVDVGGAIVALTT